MRLQAGNDLGIMFDALPSSRLDHLGGESRAAGGRDPGRVAAIRDHYCDLGLLQAPLSDCLSDSEKI